MDGDEEFFDAVSGERTEDLASPVQPGLTCSPREVRTAQESHPGGSRGLSPGPRSDLGRKLHFGRPETRREGSWVFIPQNTRSSVLFAFLRAGFSRRAARGSAAAPCRGGGRAGLGESRA